MSELIELNVGGKKYTGWYRCRIVRSLEKCASEARLEIVENQIEVEWPTNIFAPCTITVSGTLMMTGFITEYLSNIEAGRHSIEIVVRSRTIDIVDSVTEIPFQQIFRGNTLSAIAKTVCDPFGIKVVTQANSGALNPMLFTNFFLDETIFNFLERLARTQQILLTDDVYGDLVLTNAGFANSTTAVILGENIVSAQIRNNVDHRFYKYLVRTQANYLVEGPTTDAATQNIGKAIDDQVPITRQHRVHAITAENQGDGGMAQNRADWLMKYARGQSYQLRITVPGWREISSTTTSNGSATSLSVNPNFGSTDAPLFKPNTITPVDLRRLGIPKQDLLLVEVRFQCDERGFYSDLTLGPVDGYKPDPFIVIPRIFPVGSDNTNLPHPAPQATH